MDIREKYSPEIPFIPYLIYPVKEHSRISEGYIYSREERARHGNFWHKGIDIEAPYGAPVYAAASGYAVAGYHRFILRNKDKTFKLFEGKPMANGLGYFVQIYHPEEVCHIPGGRITQYGHLSKIVESIGVKVTKPVEINNIYKVLRKFRLSKDPNKKPFQIERKLRETEDLIGRYPWVTREYGYSFTKDIETKESYLYTPDELASLYKQRNPYVKWVNQGEYIGNVGISAVFYGLPNYIEGSTAVDLKKPNNAWDEVHLHFEEAARAPETGLKHQTRDPFDLYKSFIQYQNSSNIAKSLFIDNPSN